MHVDDIYTLFDCISALKKKGEMLEIANISRDCEGIYECVAQNGILPNAHRRVTVTVLCEF